MQQVLLLLLLLQMLLLQSLMLQNTQHLMRMLLLMLLLLLLLLLLSVLLLLLKLINVLPLKLRREQRIGPLLQNVRPHLMQIIVRLLLHLRLRDENLLLLLQGLLLLLLGLGFEGNGSQVLRGLHLPGCVASPQRLQVLGTPEPRSAQRLMRAQLPSIPQRVPPLLGALLPTPLGGLLLR